MSKTELISSLSVAYDKNGQPASYKDQNGYMKSFERNSFGQIIKEYFPDDTSVEYSYNETSKLSHVTDQNKHQIQFDWNRFGIDAKTTAANQLTDYVYDKYGLLSNISSSHDGKQARNIKYTYDKFDRPVKITYADKEEETFTYDSRGKLVASSRGAKKATYKYDYFGRMTEKAEGSLKTTYAYNRYGQRTSRVTQDWSLSLKETRRYDRFGRLVEIKSNEKNVKYLYNSKNQLASQIVDGMPIRFSYTKYGQLEYKILGNAISLVSSLRYLYSKDGRLIGRVVNDKWQKYSYDKKGQLLSVSDKDGNVIEKYAYDPAGNILSKTVNDRTTDFTYDKANQLATSVTDGKVTNYRYDAAGRLVQEGDKFYRYGYLDKVVSVNDGRSVTASFDYHVDGQLASVVRNGREEKFLWDGLALIHRGETSYINEPYVTGGNPIFSTASGVMFNDILGNTLGTKGAGDYAPVAMTAFGDTDDKSAMFTGKPFINELGYAFLFRNYRANLGKWLSSDPLGYPDGWNNLAYCNNGVTMRFDYLGAAWCWVEFSFGISKIDDGVVMFIGPTFLPLETPLPPNVATLTQMLYNKLVEYLHNKVWSDISQMTPIFEAYRRVAYEQGHGDSVVPTDEECLVKARQILMDAGLGQQSVDSVEIRYKEFLSMNPDIEQINNYIVVNQMRTLWLIHARYKVEE